MILGGRKRRNEKKRKNTRLPSSINIYLRPTGLHQILPPKKSIMPEYDFKVTYTSEKI
jgi:hypothetical protein